MESPCRRVRFSLKEMFVVTTLAAGIYYWLMLPSITAAQFARALEAGDYPQVTLLFREGAAEEFVPVDEIDTPPHVEIKPLTLGQLLRGERDMVAGVCYRATDNGVADCAYVLSADRSGVIVLYGLP